MTTTIKNIISLILTIVLFGCISHKKTGQEYFELGQTYENSGELKKALKAYTKAIKKNNKEPYYYVKKAEMLYLAPTFYNDNDKKSHKRIEDTYNMSFHLVPWYEQALISRATYKYRQDRPILARRDLDSLIKKYPNNIEGYLLLSKIYFDCKDSINAVYNLNKALEKANGNNETLIEVGEIYQDYKKYRPAIKLYRQVLDKSDKLVFSKYYSLALCYYRLNNTDSACYFYSIRPSKNCFSKECKDIESKCGMTK